LWLFFLTFFFNFKHKLNAINIERRRHNSQEEEQE